MVPPLKPRRVTERRGAVGGAVSVSQTCAVRVYNGGASNARKDLGSRFTMKGKLEFPFQFETTPEVLRQLPRSK